MIVQITRVPNIPCLKKISDEEKDALLGVCLFAASRGPAQGEKIIKKDISSSSARTTGIEYWIDLFSVIDALRAKSPRREKNYIGLAGVSRKYRQIILGPDDVIVL